MRAVPAAACGFSQAHRHRAMDRDADLWFKTREASGSPPRPAGNTSASRDSRRFDLVTPCIAFATLLTQDVDDPSDASVPCLGGLFGSRCPGRLGEQFPGQSPNAHCMPCSTGVLLISVQERRRAAENDLVISLVQSAHNKAKADHASRARDPVLI